MLFRSDDDDSPVRAKSDRDVQMLLFSATMPGWICKLTDKHMIDPIFLDAVQEGDSRLAAEITHFAVPLPPVGDRFSSVVSCIEDLILTKGMTHHYHRYCSFYFAYKQICIS